MFLMFAFIKPLEFSGCLHEGLSKEHVLRISIQKELEFVTLEDEGMTILRNVRNHASNTAYIPEYLNSWSAVSSTM
jgi:hypothetical protein